VEDLPVDMETVSGSPAAIKSFKRTITHDKLTKHFSSEEHLKAEDWHGATKLHVTQAALDPADTSPGERRVLVASASVRDLETRPDWLYGPGSGRALMMGASSVGKSPPAASRARSAGSVVAEEVSQRARRAHQVRAQYPPLLGWIGWLARSERISVPKTCERGETRPASLAPEASAKTCGLDGLPAAEHMTCPTRATKASAKTRFFGSRGRRARKPAV
jgi:hypothetical protein